jgi:membrane protease YdiL (CAAX protease family)
MVHILWTVSTFQVLVLNWWVFFRSRDVAEWTFGGFVLVVTWAVIFYLLAVVLYPPDLKQSEDYGEVFENNRVWFLALWIASNFSGCV